MKTKKVSKNSWHCELAQMGGHSVYDTTTICKYTRQVFYGILASIFLIAILAFLFFGALFLTGHMLYGIAMSLYAQKFEFTEPGFVGLLIYSATAFCFTVQMFASGKWRLWPKREAKKIDWDAPPKEPGFLGQMWEAYNKKFCYELETVSDYELAQDKKNLA